MDDFKVTSETTIESEISMFARHEADAKTHVRKRIEAAVQRGLKDEFAESETEINVDVTDVEAESL